MVWLHRKPGASTATVLSVGAKVVTANPRVSVWREAQTWTLTVQDVDRDDVGAYMCQVNTTPPRNQQGIVTVLGE